MPKLPRIFINCKTNRNFKLTKKLIAQKNREELKMIPTEPVAMTTQTKFTIPLLPQPARARKSTCIAFLFIAPYTPKVSVTIFVIGTL